MTTSDDSDHDEVDEVPHPVSVESLLRNDDQDTLRILLSTDNHLGYAERDNIRGMDSFAAFEEVLYLAKRFHCDMVLIAGDLFHDNRPSRRTLHKTMEILRRHCLGPNAVKIQMLSDNTNIFRSTISGVVNYQDPHYSVDMPVFSIHGNHDDPSRDGAELLAALDLLAINNLVNYFGRQDEVDQIEVSPILLKKGDTKVALYGLGSMRDERLNRIWEKQKVRFLRPDDDDDDNGSDDEAAYFNIFALHQNRDLGRGTKNCVHESMIPEWMDIVVWGHEHECLIEFFESVVGTFRITQPGSSVATSLVSGEAARKKIGILDINGKNFRLHPVPLTQVRSFVTTELSLREHKDGLDSEDPKVDIHVAKVLEEEVRFLVIRAREKYVDLLRDAQAAGNDANEKDSTIKYKLQNPDQVLVRIRVEHFGFSTLNNQRFGAKFVGGDIANPSDILLFHRKKDPKLASSVKKNAIKPIAPEELERTNMEDLVREQLAIPESKLQLFGEKALAEALEDYVDKSSTVAITDTAEDMLNKAQKELIMRRQVKASENESVVDDSFEQDSSIVSADAIHETTKKRKATDASIQKSSTLHNKVDENDASQRSKGRQRVVRKLAPSRARASAREDDSSDGEAIPAKTTRTATSKPAKRAVTTRKAVGSLDESDDDEVLSDDVYDSVDSDDFDNGEATSTRKRAAKSVPKANESLKRKTASSRKRKEATKAKRRTALDSDDEIEIIDETADLDGDWGSAATKTQRSAWS